MNWLGFAEFMSPFIFGTLYLVVGLYFDEIRSYCERTIKKF